MLRTQVIVYMNNNDSTEFKHSCHIGQWIKTLKIFPMDYSRLFPLIHWGRVTHICVSKLTIIGSDNGLSPDWRQAIIWTNAGLLLIGPLGTNFSEVLIEILTFSFKKMRLKVSSAKRRPFCLGLNVFKHVMLSLMSTDHFHCQVTGCCLVNFVGCYFIGDVQTFLNRDLRKTAIFHQCKKKGSDILGTMSVCRWIQTLLDFSMYLP